jgi:1,4-alpha-glucan branching enzyme
MGFVRDVMDVWFDELGVDGMRFDHTLGFYRWKDQTVGAGAVAAAAGEIGGDDCYRVAEHFSNDHNELELLKDSAFNSSGPRASTTPPTTPCTTAASRTSSTA